jgi:hypothetical protein
MYAAWFRGLCARHAGCRGGTYAQLADLANFFLSRPVFANPDAPPARDQVDPATAQGLSIAVTVIAPLTLFALGAKVNNARILGLGAIALLVGPSTGRW